MLNLLKNDVFVVGFLEIATLPAAILHLDVTIKTALSKPYQEGSIILTSDIDKMFLHDERDLCETANFNCLILSVSYTTEFDSLLSQDLA